MREQLRGLSHAGDVGKVIRTHGDYHLGQALWTDGGWVILDFEGEPARPIVDRRRKRSPLRDVAGMLRSFALRRERGRDRARRRAARGLGACARVTSSCSGISHRVDSNLIPSGSALDRLLAVFELEKAVYELRYELDNRPAGCASRSLGIARLLERAGV